MCTGQHVPKNTEMSLCLSGARGFCEEKGPFFLFPWEGRLQRIKACLDNSEMKNKDGDEKFEFYHNDSIQ